MHIINYYNINESSMHNIAEFFSRQLINGVVVYFKGNLGVGKTSFIRSIVKSKGFLGGVKSPTYTLVEIYSTIPILYHFDLYRLKKPEEIEYIGIRDYFLENTICLIEWPEKGFGAIDLCDIIINISFNYTNKSRTLNFIGVTYKGNKILKEFFTSYYN